MTAESDLALHYFVVRPDASVALDRARSRISPVLTDEEPVRKMYAEFSGLGSFEAYVLDNSRETPDETATHIVERVASSSHRLSSGSVEL